MTQPNDTPNAFEEQVKTQVKDKNTWLRLFYIILFALIFYVVFFVVCASGIIQFVARILSGAPLTSLHDFNSKLADYSKELVAYVTFASDTKPFPFKE